MAERDPIDVIREQLGRVDGLAGLHPEHDLFLSWHSETKAVLEKIFSSRSIHYQSFVALRFREVSAKGFASPEIDKINAGRYRRDLESVKNILQGYKELTLTARLQEDPDDRKLLTPPCVRVFHLFRILHLDESGH
jgi:hypothetical protein